MPVRPGGSAAGPPASESTPAGKALSGRKLGGRAPSGRTRDGEELGEPSERDTGSVPRLPVEVRRSGRRKRTVSADIRDGAIRVSIPAHFSVLQEREWVERMVTRISAKYLDVPTPSAAGRDLLERAEGLARTYLGGRGIPTSITWVTNQNSRWASATPAHRSVRLSHRLQGMPEWVIDYVILHELSHLIEPSHNARFWSLLEGYPHTATAKAFLDGAAFASSRGLVNE